MAAKDQSPEMVPRSGNVVCSLRNQRSAGSDLIAVVCVGHSDVTGGIMYRPHRSEQRCDLRAPVDCIWTTLAETAALTGIDDLRRLTTVGGDRHGLLARIRHR